MKDEKFVTIKENNISKDLYIDRVLFESYYPILFSCITGDKEHFICVCCQNNKKGEKWLIGKTNPNNIIEMLEDNITIRDLFLNHTSLKITVNKKIDGEMKLYYNNKDWKKDSIYLPKPASYIDSEEGEFDDDIEYYRRAASFSSMYHASYIERLIFNKEDFEISNNKNYILIYNNGFKTINKSEKSESGTLELKKDKSFIAV